MSRRKWTMPSMSKEQTVRFIYIMKNQGRPIWDPSDELYIHKGHVARTWAKVAEAAGISVDVAKVKWKNLRDLFRREIKRYEITSLENYCGKWCYLQHLWFIFGLLKPIHIKTLEGNNESCENDETYEEYEPLEEDVNVSGPVVKEDQTEEGNVSEFFIKMEHLDENPNNDEETSIHSGIRVEAEFDPIYTESESVSKTPNITKKRRQSCEESNQDHSKVPNSSKKRKQGSNEEDFDDMFLRSLLPYFHSLEPLRKLRMRAKIQELIANEIAEQEAQSSKTV